ncbi:MAG: tetratricopeptide repeat protein [Deltaproteobacteria bacterium]|nr:tetratricopeptide repeat protein [Deltaproteobacteria bacterium]
MIYRIMLFGGLLVLLGAAYLVYLNPTETSVALTQGLKVDGTMPFFLLVAVAVGGFGSGVFFSLLALRRQVGDFFRQLRDKKKKSAQEALLEGVEAGFQGETKKAVASLNRVLKLDRKNMEAVLALARLLIRERQPGQALKTLDAALEHTPEDPRLHWYRIQALQGLDDPLRMTNQLLLMKARYPRNRALMTMLVEQFSSRGYWREALEVWQEISKGEVKGSPEKLKAVSGVANSAYELARRQWLAGNREAATASLKIVFEHDKEHLAAYLLKAQMEVKKSEALSVLKNGFRKKPNAVFLLEEERLQLEDDPENSAAKMLKSYRKVLSRNPEYRPARWLYARFCLEHQKFDEAEVAAKRLRESGFTGPLLEILEGELACHKEHRLEAAVDHFKKALGCAERLEPVFGCEVCGRLSPDWKYRCPHCSSYNSYDISERVCSFV